MADQVEEKEPAAGPSHVANKSRQFGGPEMMAEIHRERKIGGGQPVADRVGSYDWEWSAGIRRGVKIGADDLDTEAPLDLPQYSAARAPYVEDTPDRQRIPARGCNNRPRVAQEAVNCREVPIGSVGQRFGHIAPIEDFAFRRLLHRSRCLNYRHPGDSPRGNRCKTAYAAFASENARVSSVQTIQIVGAGPAGAAAALGALRESAAVRIAERSRATRHKVCGEFISSEACSILEQLGVWQQFVKFSPSRIRRCE